TKKLFTTLRVNNPSFSGRIVPLFDSMIIQQDQDRATIANSSTLPHDIAPRVTSPAAVKGSMQQTINELTALCTSLQRQHSELLVQFQAQEVEINKLKERVKILEDNQGVIGARSADDAPIKGRMINEEEGTTGRVSSDTEEIRMDEREAAVERTSEDTEEMATVITSMDAATVLASVTAKEIPTGSGSIPTAGVEVPTGSDMVPTASPVFVTATVVTPYSRRKGKKELENQLERENKRMSKQIARDAEVARIHAEEELQILPLERRIELISDLVKYQENYAKIYKFQSQQRRSLTKKQKRDYYMAVIRNNIGWKILSKSTDEIPEEKIKEMMQPIPIKEVYVEALQVKHPIINWKVHKEGQKSYWKIIRLGGSSACYQFFVDLLKHLDREDLNQLWILVKEYLSIRPASSDKEMELWVELKRLYEPDPEDQLVVIILEDLDLSFQHAVGVRHWTSKQEDPLCVERIDPTSFCSHWHVSHVALDKHTTDHS
nr:hypothetical protein [Tanacetum cinerariifolium]